MDGIFTVPGDGAVDFLSLLTPLAARGFEGDDQRCGVAFRRAAQAVGEGRAAHVDDFVGHDGGDDLAPQTVALHLRFEPGQGLGEVADQDLFEEGILGRLRGDDIVRQLQLGVGHQDGQFGPGQRNARRHQLLDAGVVGQALDLAVQLSLGRQGLHEALLGIQRLDPLGLLQRQGLSLQDFDYYEIHEAFAATVLSTLKAWEDEDFCREKLGRDAPLGSIDRDKLNVNGSSLAAGHPFAATGGRIVASLAKMLHEKGPGSRGLISICAAGGQGVVAIVEGA